MHRRPRRISIDIPSVTRRKSVPIRAIPEVGVVSKTVEDVGKDKKRIPAVFPFATLSNVGVTTDPNGDATTAITTLYTVPRGLNLFSEKLALYCPQITQSNAQILIPAISAVLSINGSREPYFVLDPMSYLYGSEWSDYERVFSQATVITYQVVILAGTPNTTFLFFVRLTGFIRQ